MKIFGSIRTFYRSLGIHPVQSERRVSLNPKNLLVLLFFTQGFILTAAFFLFKVKSVREFGDSFYAFATELANAIYFLSHIGKMGNILQLIENLEGFIERSKPK